MSCWQPSVDGSSASSPGSGGTKASRKTRTSTKADQATDLYQDELDESRENDLRDQLAAVERGEERLAAGTYGLSVESGQPIPDERLEARPTAELTVEEEAP